MYGASILLFAAVIGIANATPGPTIATFVARILTMGPARNLGFAIALVPGDVLWLAAAVFGLATVAREAHEVMVVLKYAGAAYILYLAYRMWTAPAVDLSQASGSRRMRLGSLRAASRWRSAIPRPCCSISNLVPLTTISTGSSQSCRCCSSSSTAWCWQST
jgi:threonine/homoserine/homoserine lactone efflux protein